MIQGLIAGIAGRIQSVIDSFKRIIASIVGVFTGDVTIAEAASAVVGAMVDVWKAVTPDLALFRWVQDSVEGAIQGVIDWISGRDVEGAGSGLVGRFLRGIIDRVGDVVAAFTGLWDLIKGTFVTGEADLGDLARGVWDAIVAVFRASPAGLLFGWIAPKLSEAWEALKERAAAIDVEGEGAGLVARFVAGFVGRIEDVIAAAAGLWDAIVGAFVTGEADMTEVANGIWNAVVAVFRLTPAGLFFEWIAPKLTAAWDAAKAAIEERGGLAESIVKGFEEDVVLNAIGSLWDKAKARVEERGGLFAPSGRASRKTRSSTASAVRGTLPWRRSKSAAACAGHPPGATRRSDPPGADSRVRGHRRSDRHRVGQCHGGDPRAGGSTPIDWHGLQEDATLNAIVGPVGPGEGGYRERGGLWHRSGRGSRKTRSSRHRQDVGQGRGGDPAWWALAGDHPGLKEDDSSNLIDVVLRHRRRAMEARSPASGRSPATVVNPIKEFFGGGEGEDAIKAPIGRGYWDGSSAAALRLPIRSRSGPPPGGRQLGGRGGQTISVGADQRQSHAERGRNS